MSVEFVLEKGVNPPVLSHKLDVGYDIRSNETVSLPKRGMKCVSTGVRIKSMPTDLYIRIGSRSGLSFKHRIEVGAGVIDPNYTGGIKVILYNHSDVEYKIEKGDKIAQLIFTKISRPDIKISESMNESIDSRGNDGFGSTGKK